jgi:hypothetical protein
VEDLPALLSRALPLAQPERMGLFTLRSDPQLRHLLWEEQRDVVRVVLQAGEQAARDLQARYAARAPSQLAEQLGVRVTICEEDARYGSILQYADYRSHPPEVRVYRRAMDRLNRLLADAAVGEMLGIQDATPVFVAHELFHHLDNLPGHQSVKRQRQVVVLKLGPIRVRSGLITAPEIAAGSFTQELLSLRFHPKLLDLVAIYSENPAHATAWVQRLASMSG